MKQGDETMPPMLWFYLSDLLCSVRCRIITILLGSFFLEFTLVCFFELWSTSIGHRSIYLDINKRIYIYYIFLKYLAICKILKAQKWSQNFFKNTRDTGPQLSTMWWQISVSISREVERILALKLSPFHSTAWHRVPQDWSCVKKDKY